MAEQEIDLEGASDTRSDVEHVADRLNIHEDDAEDLIKGWEELRTAQGIVFQIYRTEPAEKAGFCTEYPSAQFTQSRLAREWGPGTYRIRIKGEGGRYVKGGGTIKIAATETLDDPRARVGAETSSVQDMLALLKADREKQAGNLKEWAAILAPLLAPVIANLFTQKRETVSDMVNALGALKQLEPPAAKAPDALAEIEKVGLLLERAKALAGDDKTQVGSTWVDVIRDGLAGVKDLIASGAGAQMIGRLGARPPMIPLLQPQPVLTSAPGSVPFTAASPSSDSQSGTGAAGTPVASTEPVQGGGDVGLMAFLPWLRATLDSLVFQAARNKDPNLYADVTLDNLPDGLDVREVLKLIEAEDWWKNLQQIAPGVIPYAGWFKEFRDALVKEIKKLIEGASETE